MALFGRKNNNDKDNDNKDISSQDNDLDAMIMAAIEETRKSFTINFDIYIW